MGRLGRIVIIGSGNVATHLAKALDERGEVIQVVSRHLDHARELAAALRQASATDDLSLIEPHADIYIIAVSDDAITDVAAATPSDGLWLHTSGSVPADALKSYKTHYGVLYPLQTFSRDVAVDVAKVPFFVEGSSPEDTNRAIKIARSLSPTVIEAGSDERRGLHIAAVLACNFTNHLWALADDLLHRQGLDFKVLEPLLRATIDKALAVTPAKSQTGPASRGDRKVVESHIASLPPHEAEIYRMLSQSIMNYHK